MNEMDEMDEMDEVIQEFIVESNENLDNLDNDLLALEEDPSNAEIMGSIFRTIHTIKGTCGFLGFGKLEKVSHVGENLLSKLREGELQLTKKRTTALLQMVDAIRQMLVCVEETKSDGEKEYLELIEILAALQIDDAEAEQGDTPPDAAPSVEAEFPEEEVKVKPIGEMLVSSGVATSAQVADAIKQQLDGNKAPVGEILVNQGVVDKGSVAKAVDKQSEAKSRAPAASAGSIRVDVNLLDQLMNLVGELVLIRNQVLQFGETFDSPVFSTTSQHLSQVTSELQEQVMQTRMQPIGGVWSKFPRVVRDLSQGCGKQVRLEMEGKETDLDKSLIEAIKDPLTHLVRNSVDHGIEMPEVRSANGKPAEGVITLRAYHEGGQVNIEICDDGAGIDPEKLKNKALEKGLISEDQAERMGEKEALNLIFKAGFSTAAAVTNISGRGVGMDVVKTNIENLGGVVDISSRLGEGTTMRIKIPLTLAIIPALTISCAGDRYAIPQINLMELLLLEGEDAKSGIENLHGVPVYRLRGKLLPLLYLNKELWNEEPAEDEEANNNINIVVLKAGELQFGLVVDEVNDTQEVVVKPLGKQLKGISSLAGATIMGDGHVAIILDVFGLADNAKLLSEATHQGEGVHGEQEVAEESEKVSLVLLRNPDGGRMTVPLSEVTRLEEIQRTSIERVGNEQVVRYRGQIMTLIDVFSLLPERRSPERITADAQKDAESVVAYQPAESSSVVQVVVCTKDGKAIGLVVDQVLDVAEEAVEISGESSRKGVSATAVIQDRVTEFLDVDEVIAMSKVKPDGQARRGDNNATMYI
ncbi:two-component system, chemotaxis family, sensor kinase CheA [Mariprofundus aestuarium]|uniref:Chemotaxis protein CheA n=1 Tax=Mariprofundus aestuarium TaxID=1921086 RepID=A0A2K8KXI1_MARES|nr:chemotaxis protein CheA [Mariprofundus aestuarium]ATX78549.1 two-component system, chemotaxis family, sensor kinase CheA [Mariprofundus aestuarium]